MDPIQEFSKVKLTLDNVIIPTERLRHTPSSRDGCPHELEVDLRILSCEYIQTAGVLLRLPQVAMATAQVLFQRFFYSKSFVKYNMLNVAMACLFLAAKIEENCRRIRDVVNVFHHLKQKRMGRPVVPMEYMGEEYFKMKASVIKYERFVLKELGFCVHIKHPHKLIIVNLRLLGLEENTQLVQKAWNYMNDSLRTNVFVRFAPDTIACACVFLSARHLKIPLPQKPPWWTVSNVCFEDIEAISLEILALYKRPRVFLLDLEKKLTLIKEEYSKKQIEIREVNLKKKLSDDSPGSVVSPAGGGGASAAVRSSPESPAVRVHSKLQPSPLAQSALHKDSPLPISNSNSPHLAPPITNGSEAKDRSPPPLPLSSSSSSSNRKPRPRSSSPASGPPHPKRKKLQQSCSPLDSKADSEERGSGRGRLVISPIRFGSNPPPSAPSRTRVGGYSDESGYSDNSGSSPTMVVVQENGIVPKQYRGDYSKHNKARSSSSSKHSRHHRSATENTAIRSSHHERHHHHHHHHRSLRAEMVGDRDRGRSRERDRTGRGEGTNWLRAKGGGQSQTATDSSGHMIPLVVARKPS